MAKEFSTESVSPGASIVVLETERLTLRRPTLADVKAIACLADDARIAENTRRLPHPFTLRDAEALVVADIGRARGARFLIAHDGMPIGIAGLETGEPHPELDCWLGVEFWGHGFATEAVRAVIDHAFETSDATQLCAGARVVHPASRRVLEKCGFQWTGVELHRFRALGSSTPVDRFRLDRGVWASLRRWRAAARRDDAPLAAFMPAAE
jgi:RimJ/RimL family protein N-acetyltransferase